MRLTNLILKMTSFFLMNFYGTFINIQRFGWNLILFSLTLLILLNVHFYNKPNHLKSAYQPKKKCNKKKAFYILASSTVQI